MPRKSSGVGGLGVFGGLICSASERRLAERVSGLLISIDVHWRLI